MSARVKRRQTLLAEVAILPPEESVILLSETRIVPGGTPLTAAHVPSAVIHRCDYLLTWNMRRIANSHIRRVIEAIIEERGYANPTICTPEEL